MVSSAKQLHEVQQQCQGTRHDIDQASGSSNTDWCSLCLTIVFLALGFAMSGLLWTRWLPQRVGKQPSQEACSSRPIACYSIPLSRSYRSDVAWPPLLCPKTALADNASNGRLHCISSVSTLFLHAGGPRFVWLLVEALAAPVIGQASVTGSMHHTTQGQQLATASSCDVLFFELILHGHPCCAPNPALARLQAPIACTAFP